MAEVIAVPGDVAAWRVGDTQFVRYFGQGSTPERFLIQKDQSGIDLYAELCPSFRHGRIVELGIAAGGSTALLALLTSPTKLVACEFSPNPVPALASFIEQHGLAGVVRPFFGVDQGDRERVAAIVDGEMGDHPLDLVIDDASHVWDKTIASFEVLFPRLRPGGLFIVEDWPTQYLAAQAITEAQADPTSPTYARLRADYDEAVRKGAPARPPLARLGVELMLAAASSPDVIVELTVNQHWLVVERGEAPLDRAQFRLSDLYTDHFGWLHEEPGDWWLRRLWER